jgi:hypothetical protein
LSATDLTGRSKITNVAGAFSNCLFLKNYIWMTHNIAATNLANICSNCSNITDVRLFAYDSSTVTANVPYTNLYQAFLICSNLVSIYFAHMTSSALLNTASITGGPMLNWSFYQCVNLTSLSIANFVGFAGDFQKLYYAFGGCYNLKVNMSVLFPEFNFRTDPGTRMRTFAGDTNLVDYSIMHNNWKLT